MGNESSRDILTLIGIAIAGLIVYFLIIPAIREAISRAS